MTATFDGDLDLDVGDLDLDVDLHVNLDPNFLAKWTQAKNG